MDLDWTHVNTHRTGEVKTSMTKEQTIVVEGKKKADELAKKKQMCMEGNRQADMERGVLVAVA